MKNQNPAARTVDIVLVGPRAGQTIQLCGLQFNQGIAVVPVSALSETFLYILARDHNAHVVGSMSHEEAEMKWDMSRAPAAVTGKPDAAAGQKPAVSEPPKPAVSEPKPAAPAKAETVAKKE